MNNIDYMHLDEKATKFYQSLYLIKLKAFYNLKLGGAIMSRKRFFNHWYCIFTCSVIDCRVWTERHRWRS